MKFKIGDEVKVVLMGSPLYESLIGSIGKITSVAPTNKYPYEFNNKCMCGEDELELVEPPKIRGFEICKGYENNNINLPKRSTTNSSGYDFECAEDTVIPPLFLLQVMQYPEVICTASHVNKENDYKPTLVPTGIKSYMQKDEALFLYNRSGNPFKKGLVLANSVGVIDSDYYSNPDNDGHIMFAFYNFTDQEVVIKKGERIGQGVFQKYLKSDDDNANGDRISGFGSTGS